MMDVIYQTILIMGVCGTGKTTLGQSLSQRLNCPFIDADSFHTENNISKMSKGIPLSDEDRWPWLDQLNLALERETNRYVCLACSALKKSYRLRLKENKRELLCIYLKGSEALILQRLNNRSKHFAKSNLLESQLSTLEAPTPSREVLELEIDSTIDQQIQICLSWLNQLGASSLK